MGKRTRNLLIREENKAWSLRKRQLNLTIKHACLAERTCRVANLPDVSARNAKKGAWGLPVQRPSDYSLEPWGGLEALGLQGINKAQLLPSRSSRSNKFTHSSDKYLLNTWLCQGGCFANEISE